MLVELSELNRIRVEHDLTYGALAKEVGLTESAIYRALTVPNAKLRDRTLYKIRRYLQKRGGKVAA